MNQINRRNWLRTAGLSTGMLMLGNTNAFALNQSEELFFNEELIMLNANENPFSPSYRIQHLISDNFDLICLAEFFSEHF